MTLRMNITPEDVDRATQRAGRRALEFILSESNKRVPLDTAELQRSGRVEWEDDGGRVVYDSPYAVVQHEDLTMHHPNGREAKFLENAIIENRRKIERVLGQAFEEELRAGS